MRRDRSTTLPNDRDTTGRTERIARIERRGATGRQARLAWRVARQARRYGATL